MLKAGLDIGGTKCAAVIGEAGGGNIRILGRTAFTTQDFASPEDALRQLCDSLRTLLNGRSADGIGISCGGPLDAEKGIIQSPPNLPGWDDVHATEIVTRLTGLPAKLENDANACALAEWKFGAGRGTRNMIFLTFGTGLGAGLIIDGKLYGGTCGMAGECGHIRLAAEGPVGYNKAGSFEGFCSGGGIARLGGLRARQNPRPAWGKSEEDIARISAKTLADAADAGDADAIAVYAESGRRLGQGLAILIDLFNPERIVIGSVFARSPHLLRPEMEKMLAAETLPQSLQVCKIVPAELGNRIGDIACLAICG